MYEKTFQKRIERMEFIQNRRLNKINELILWGTMKLYAFNVRPKSFIIR
jgi:hypothetical protein